MERPPQETDTAHYNYNDGGARGPEQGGQPTDPLPCAPPSRCRAATKRRCSPGDQHLLAFLCCACCRRCAPAASVTALLAALGEAAAAGDERDRSATGMALALAPGLPAASPGGLASVGGLAASGTNALDTWCYLTKGFGQSRLFISRELCYAKTIRFVLSFFIKIRHVFWRLTPALRTLWAAAAPLVLAVLSSWLPQLQSCTELIQLRLSLASASASAKTAPSFAGGGGAGGAKRSDGRRRCCASSSLSQSITARRGEEGRR